MYCFARPTHRYLDLDTGDDFERKIVVKVNAVERLRAELRAPKWAGDHIAMGTNTDPYQPAEGRYRLTRGLIEALSEARNPFSILTKSTMILRDLDLLVEAAKRTTVGISFSIGTLDERAWRTSEPGTPPPRQRVEALRRLVDAGIECGVLVAPVLPGISDAPEQLEEVVTPVSMPARPPSRRSSCTCDPACASSTCPGCNVSAPTSLPRTRRCMPPPQATRRRKHGARTPGASPG